MAEDLSPTQALKSLDRELVHGIATDVGGLTSHTAILARSMDIPTIVGIGDVSGKAAAGDPIIINGNSGKVILHPTPDSQVEMNREAGTLSRFQRLLEDIKFQPAVTLDGREIKLWGTSNCRVKRNPCMRTVGRASVCFAASSCFLTFAERRRRKTNSLRCMTRQP